MSATWKVLQGDCIEVMRDMESGSFDEGSYEESSYEEAGEEDFGPMVHVRGGKTVGVDVDANGINME